MYKLVSRALALIVLFALVATSFVYSGRPVQARGGDYQPGEVLVKLTSGAQLSAVAARYKLDLTPLDQFGSRPIYRLRILDGADPQRKARQLAADSASVVYAEPNYRNLSPESRQRVSWAKGTRDDYAAQWFPAKINLPGAQRLSRGAGVTVAVLDTGVDSAHPALAGHLLAGYDFVDMDADPREGGTSSDPGYGHGTHVAGLIALVAPEAKIMPLRVLDSSGVGNLWVLAEALAYAVDPDSDPQTNDGASVINLSLSTLQRTELIGDLLDDEINSGAGRSGEYAAGGSDVVVVAAAGNSASDGREYPAGEGVAGLLAVAASTKADALAPFSNYGSWVGIAAPGTNIVSTMPGGGYASWSGTSMAAPLAAGTAALVRSRYPDIDAAAVRHQIERSGVSLDGGVEVRLDAAAALAPLSESGND